MLSLFGSRRSSESAESTEKPLRNLDWEVELAVACRRSEKVAWRVAGGFAVLSLSLAAAVMLMTPLRQVVPYVVTVDKLTGESSVVSTDAAVSATPMSDKHWLKRFVVARERYSYAIVQQDYLTVRRLAADGPWSTYARMFEGESNLDKRYGENVTIIPTVLSVTLHGGGLATVRYELTHTDRRLVTPPVVSRHAATIRYAYTKRVMVEAEAIENPLGFQVSGYQSDPELVEERK